MRELNLQAIDMNLLRVFDTVYRERHLTRAGKYLCLTQPAMSHALSRLRALFGDELFVRTPRGMDPTPAAEQLAAPVAEAIAAVQRVLQSVNRFDPRSVRLTFRLGVTDHSSSVVLPPLLRRLQAEAPGVDVHAVHVNVESAHGLLDEGQLHMAIVASGEHPDRFASRHVLREPLVCLASSSNAAVGDPMTPEQFAALPHIVVAPSQAHRSLVDRLLAARNLHRRIVLSIPFLTAVPRLVAGSNLVCTIPRSIAEDARFFGDFRIAPVPLDDAVFDYFAVWHLRDEAGSAHRWLREVVFEAVPAALRAATSP